MDICHSCSHPRKLSFLHSAHTWHLFGKPIMINLIASSLASQSTMSAYSVHILHFFHLTMILGLFTCLYRFSLNLEHIFWFPVQMIHPFPKILSWQCCRGILYVSSQCAFARRSTWMFSSAHLQHDEVIMFASGCNVSQMVLHCSFSFLGKFPHIH